MTQTAGLEFERRVADAIRHLDYEVKIEPREIAKRGTWQERLISWMTQPTYIPAMPSMVVSNGEKVALVEPKAYPILLGPVIQARHYADYFGAPIIICVPDEAFQHIPDSVREWAANNEIALVAIGEIGEALKSLLEPAATHLR